MKTKVFQVIECGGPGGTGEQVAAICNGLDPERFEVSLVYASRETAHEDYRAKCSANCHYFCCYLGCCRWCCGLYGFCSLSCWLSDCNDAFAI